MTTQRGLLEIRDLNKIQNDKLFSKMESPEIFDEIKKSCKSKNSDLTSVIDDVHGAQNISNHFKDIYEKLYNEQGDLNGVLIAEVNEGNHWSIQC